MRGQLEQHSRDSIDADPFMHHLFVWRTWQTPRRDVVGRQCDVVFCFCLRIPIARPHVDRQLSRDGRFANSHNHLLGGDLHRDRLAAMDKAHRSFVGSVCTRWNRNLPGNDDVRMDNDRRQSGVHHPRPYAPNLPKRPALAIAKVIRY